MSNLNLQELLASHLHHLLLLKQQACPLHLPLLQVWSHQAMGYLPHHLLPLLWECVLLLPLLLHHQWCNLVALLL